MENKAMKFNPNLPTEVELSFDEPKTGEGQYGTWYLYGTKETINGESGFFATQILHELLQGLGVKTGSKLVITKVVKDDRTAWDVKQLGSQDPVKEEAAPQQNIKGVVAGLANALDANKDKKPLTTEQKIDILWTNHLKNDMPF
tara:strand:- start:3001 stop:3432 length:432 start_codon:yes stop_codon:yes gene_type:complete